ncbi:MAG: electron transfer flavoprotein subunit beta/FixA family protein [Proteobacteria bacterium]|nr:electron transfer flavoprotein subunit beta/FixA family protein [Pseudomonadota bacterium]
MKILVCLKQVPHKDARLDIAGHGTWIDDANLKFEINDYDNYALEAALRIKDAGEAEVIVATIGPDRVVQSLRTALGMGADRAVHVKDEALEGSDSLGVAKSLAAIAAQESPDLILTGLMSDDANYGLTGPMLAELSGLPHATGIVSCEHAGESITVERELEGGALEVVELPLPALVTVQTGMNEVRYASLKGIMQAKKKPLETKSVADLGLQASDVAPKVTIEKIYMPPKGEGAEILQGSAAEVSQQLVTKIKELGLL